MQLTQVTAASFGLRGSRFATLILLVSMFCAAGCGNKDRGVVAGQVTLDGEPIATGSIIFIPTRQGQAKATGGTITDDRYRLAGDAAPVIGNYRVEIRANRKTGRMVQKPMAPRGEMGEAIEEAVATRYNDRAELTFEVKPGKNRADWEVVSR